MSSFVTAGTQVSESDLLAQNAQDTANEVAGNVNDINSDNKLTPSEKLKLKQEYDKDVELYNIDIEQLKSVDLPTAELETAMSNLTNFITPLFKEMNKTSTVDRNTLDSVFTAFATADKNASQTFVNMVQQVADDAKKAGDDAKEVGEKAQEAGEEAKASADQAKTDASQAKADASAAQNKAQSSIDQLNAATTKLDGEITDAKNSAQQALDNITVVDSKVTNLSTSTTAQFNTLNNGYQEVISTVNNMTISNRNLALGTATVFTMTGENRSNQVQDGCYGFSSVIPLGTVVTISFDVSSSTGVGDFTMQFYGGEPDGKPASSWQIISEGSLVNGTKHISVTLTTDSDHLHVRPRLDNATGTVTISNFIISESSKEVSWSPAPEDLASQTQITTLNNLIDQKVSNDQYQSDKTQTADLISQTVKDVSGLKTEVNQVSDDVQILATTGGQKNLVYNSSYANNAEGWNMFNKVGYLTYVASSSYNGSPGFAVNVSGMGASTWTEFGQSKHYTLPQSDTVATENTYSGSAMIKISADSDSTATLSATIAYYDKNDARIAGWKDMYITFDKKEVWTEVKFENLPVPKGAYSIGMQYWAYGPKVHGMIAQPMIVFGPKIGQYQPDVVNSSELDVSINGIQTTVTNGLKDLTTKVSQTDSAWRASVSTLGTTNMVYNGGFAHGVDGWNTNNGKWAWSNQAQDQVQGNNAIQAIFTGLTTDTWNSAASKFFLVCPGQKMSIGAIVTPWVLDSDPQKGFGLVLEFFASKDGTGTRNNYHPEQWVYTTGRQQLKVENITVPDGVNSAVVRLFIQRNGGANFTCVQANMTPILPQFIDGFATATDITASINDINLKVSNSDGSSSQVNINNDTILLDANKIIFNGNTSIQNGTIGTAKIANAAINTAQIADGAINNAKIANASIDDAKINSLNGNKIVAGSITSKQLNANDIIANVINGKTINGITINTPTLDLGLNGTLTTDFNIDQDTSLYAPKKGTGTLTIKTGVINSRSQNMSRYSSTAAYWYGFDDNGNMVKNGTNPTGDDYAPGYEKHDIMKSNGNVLNRSYLDAMALALNEGGTQTFNTMLTAIGLETGNALLHKDLATEGTFEARLGTDNTYGFKIDTQVVSPMIRANSYTYAANVFISSYGTMGLTTSTKANKLDIVDVPDMLQKGYNLLTLNPRQWFDKTSVEAYADVQSGNSDSIESVVNIKPVTGMVAEEVASAGLDDYVVKDENNKVQGLAYDRLWTLLLPVLRDMNDKINKLQKKEGI